MRVAAVQLVSNMDLESNLERTRFFMQQAQDSKVDVVVFPETFLTFGAKTTLDVDKQQYLLDVMSALARQHGIWIVAGTLPLNLDYLFGCSGQVDAKPSSATVVFDDEGNIQGKYSKIHLFDADINDDTKIYRESDRYTHGTAVPVFAAPWGDFGIAICYDLRFPELFIRLSETACKVIFIPSAFTEKTGEAHWEILIRARAIETQCFVVAANQGGAHENGQRTWGQSMVVNPWGEILSKIDKGEGLVVADLVMSELEKIRQKMPIRQHRRLDVR